MPQEDKNAPVNALHKCFALIEQLAQRPDTLTSLSKKTNMPKSTAYRFLGTLIDLGVIEKNDYEEYSLTARLFEYGAAALNAKELIALVMPYLHKLQDKTKETAHFAVMNGANVTYLYKVDSTDSLQLHSRIGYSTPAITTSLGLSMLAWMPEILVNKVISETTFIPHTPKTITTVEQLRQRLNDIRQQGYACDIEEHQENIICLGVPIFDYYSRVMAAISISIPKFRFKVEQQNGIVQSLVQIAKEISSQFGCTKWRPDLDKFPIY